ncbi:Phosphate transport system permease protein PstC [Fulvivirga imtechensis AK7]|uniref:Phosphate transport system permease protein n=1 Tax=Fulvivirga imtechensis AK7 TaxID=1237149 RepID=L8K0B6_9BACT|nr:phosphate ABC transporter permease subunit PstC [Fulvivirga imtechensis]ELR73374.1 Phosphate transport system permease protein PstC [Fulvivirga imtechensis AK7]
MTITKRLSHEYLRKGWMQVALGIILLLPFAIGLSLLYKAWPLLAPSGLIDVLLGSEWSPMQGKFGLWPFISSSIIVSLMGLLFMVPVCLSAAIFITQFAPAWLARSLRSVIDILAGIPSVIFGLWGVMTIVPIVGDLATSYGAGNATGYSILAAGIVVSFSVMPFILNMLIELFESVSIELKESALSLGASYWQVIKDVIVRKLKPGIIASFTLGVSKAFGETIAVLMVVGNVVQVPKGLFSAGYPLPALLANNYGEMMTIPMYDAALMLSALILLIIVIFFNYIAHKVIRYYHARI